MSEVKGAAMDMQRKQNLKKTSGFGAGPGFPHARQTGRLPLIL